MNKLNQADNLVIQFICDSKKALKKYDKKIYENLKTSKHHSFYADEWKGLGISGINETIIRFIITLELSSKYALESERQYCKGSRRHADLTIWSDSSKDDPDITVEIKWCGILQGAGANFSQWSIDRIEEDLRKLRDFCKTQNKYILQIAFAPNSIDLSKENLQQNVASALTKHITKKNSITIIAADKFKTASSDSTRYFWLLCWRLKRKENHNAK